VPTFCRHNRLLPNCPICSREQRVELRPAVSPGTPRSAAPTRERRPAGSRATAGSRRGAAPAGVRVRRLERAPDDGYRAELVPGLRSSVDAERLAAELGFAAGRLRRLTESSPGLYAEVAADGDIEERSWLAFLIAYLCPLTDPDPFGGIRAARTSWGTGTQPVLDGVQTGPRTAHDPLRGLQTIDAYRAWAARAGSQSQAFSGEESWTPERRFARAFERLALPGLHRDARFDLLVTLGRLGVFELRAGALQLGGSDAVTSAAKRAFGIGDPLLLERRAQALATAAALPLEALDVALFNWDRGERATLGLDPDAVPDPGAVASARVALGF
jgi:hypothetical protein